MKNAKPIDDLEMFDLLSAAYPEKFKGDDDETWEAVQNFADELSGWDDIANLLGRIVMLSTPMKSPMTGQLSHCLGKVKITGDSVIMESAVNRLVDA